MSEGLIERYAKERSVALRNRLVEEHLYVAGLVARKFTGRGVDYDDLYQVAALALVKAVERFDPDKGVKLSTFITPSVVGEVKNYFRDRARPIRLPRRASEIQRAVEAAKSALAAELGRYPTYAELAAKTGFAMDEIIEAAEMAGASSLRSLDETQDEEGELTLAGALGVDERGYDEVETRDLLARALAAVQDREREIVLKRYAARKSQREIAEEMNVSQMTVSRMEKKALAAMRRALTGGD